MKLSDVQERWLKDAIRNAYDTGYNDARNACASPGDNAPGYRGLDIERKTGRYYADTINSCGLHDPQTGQALPELGRPEAGLDLLREAVIERRDCHKAYSEFTASIAGRFPTREERDKEVALRSALGLAERAVMDAAEALTPNV